ncbi:MAG: winged helix-turn-helix domain-containing protein [Methanomassiliicoccales archaeon]
MTDEYAVKILVATVRVSRSAQEISEKFGIPIAACYRRIRDLQKVGLVECKERRLSQEGKRVSFYLSTVKNAYVFFEGGRLRVKFELKTGGADQYGDQWHDIELDSDKQRKKEDKYEGDDSAP